MRDVWIHLSNVGKCKLFGSLKPPRCQELLFRRRALAETTQSDALHVQCIWPGRNAFRAVEMPEC